MPQSARILMDTFMPGEIKPISRLDTSALTKDGPQVSAARAFSLIIEPSAAIFYEYTRERKHIPQLERGFLLSVKEVKSAV